MYPRTLWPKGPSSPSLAIRARDQPSARRHLVPGPRRLRTAALLRKRSNRNPSYGRALLGLACQRASLKLRVGGADTRGMFVARSRPLLLVEDRLLALRMSLNAPVLATAELPAGPARAAIVVHAQGASRCFSIVIRSLRNGASVIYELEGDELDEDSGWAVALDASLSFGESMGFLFDDEMLVDRRPETLRRALVRLHEILAPPDVSDDDSHATSALEGAAEEPVEILLEDELDHAAVAVPAAPLVLLSKFRGAPPVQEGAVEAAPRSESQPVPAKPGTAVRGGATLGRVRPVRMRAVDPDAGPKLDPLVRLLADF
ncbi:MAG: hypothetical protein H6Q91_3175 [Deltaproteobacteria bacterium]|nr:hypothetical protein [Deltaproteobacteria bacterium]